MNIVNLNSQSKTVTVTLNYDEIRCVHNILHNVSVINEEVTKRDKNFNDVYLEFIELFFLVKYGTIPSFELKKICQLVESVEEEKNKDHEAQNNCYRF